MTMNANRNPRLINLAGLAGAAAALAACGGSARKTVEAPRPAMVAPPPYVASERPVHRPFGTLRAPRNERPQLVGQQRLNPPAPVAEPVEPGMFGEQAGELIPFKYTARNADVGEVLRVIIGDYLGMSYAMDPGVKGQVTMDVDDELTRADIIDMLNGLGLMYGWTIDRRADMLYVHDVGSGKDAAGLAANASAPIMQARAAIESDQVAIRVRRLGYITADDITKVISPLLTPGAKVAAVGRTLVVADTTRQLNRMSRLITALDVAPFSGVDIWTYKLANVEGDEAVEALKSIASGAGITSGPEASVAFASVEGTDRLLVISRDPTLQELIQTFVDQVDVPPDYEGRQAFLYNVQYMEPVELQKLVTDFHKDIMEDPKSAAPGIPARGVRLVVDPKGRRFIIRATPDEWVDILATIEALDTPPQQVHLTTIIAEVQRTGSLQYGVEYFLTQEFKDLGSVDFSVSPGLPVAAAGSVAFVGTDGLAIIQALQTEGDVHVLQDPYMYIADGVQASIQVGGSTPIVNTQRDTGQTGTGTDILQEIEYRETGVIVTVQPSINESGLIHAKITVEITNVGAQTDFGPEFTTRKLETEATVPHGHTVLIGGIISRDRRNSTRGIPLASDIPIVGAAFDNVDDRSVDTELFLALTPRIVNDPLKAQEQVSDFLRSAHGVRKVLTRWNDDLPAGSLNNILTPAGDVITSPVSTIGPVPAATIPATPVEQDAPSAQPRQPDDTVAPLPDRES
ncbi:MAG: hypothetical protein KDA21_12630 [Phycisphaerales bacterium]|nr:hypothetical protein [Phycisphaerales bacterium]